MADTGLFSRLRRLFSTDVIIRNEGDNQLKVFDINKIQVSGEYETNALVDRFNRIYTNSHTPQFMDTKAVSTIKHYALHFILNMTQWIQTLLLPLL
jgi:hypothetical protein